MIEYPAVAKSIIEAQENIIGPIAVERASQVKGLLLDWKSKTVTITKEPLSVIDELVGQYRELFGEISVEVCREAAVHTVGSGLLDELPASLRK